MTVGHLFGARLRLNPYFLVLLAALGAAGFLAETATLFAVVLLHELAHAAVARASGLTVRELELLPFGGVARLRDPVEFDPAVEAAVAAAGPAANALLYLVGVACAPLIEPDGRFVDAYLQANLAIGLFNLLPALPLDGGRILRAVLVRRIGFRRATELAARLGKLCAVALAVTGSVLLVHQRANVSLLVVAFFLYVAAAREQYLAPYVFARYLARKQRELERCRSLRARQVVTFEGTPVKEVMQGFAPRDYHVVWVLDPQGRVKGVATEREIIDAVFRTGVETPVGAIARTFVW